MQTVLDEILDNEACRMQLQISVYSKHGVKTYLPKNKLIRDLLIMVFEKSAQNFISGTSEYCGAPMQSVLRPFVLYRRLMA